MEKRRNKKLKLIYLMDFLWNQTDEDHVVSMQQILDYLKQNEIPAERKSIYDDLKILQAHGWEIRYRKEKPSGYYLKKHIFDDRDIATLIYVIQSSQLITERKAKALIEGVKKLCSCWKAEQLGGDIHVRNRIKTMNESISPNIEVLQKAIMADCKVSFRYTNYVGKKDEILRKQARAYQVSPWAILVIGSEYFLIAYENGKIQRFRIDQMNYIRIKMQTRTGEEAFKKLQKQ